MDRPLTPGEIIDAAGLRLTPGQWGRAAKVLRKLGFNCRPRPDGTMLVLPPGNPGHAEDEEPRYDAASAHP